MRLLVIDGNSILNRAFYGIKTLTTKDGKYTNAIYGFLTTLKKVNDETNPDAVAVAFDMRAPTFRHKAYDGYKAQRKGMPDELAGQMPPLKELLGYLGYKIVECEGYEADDILGTLAEECAKTGNECVIATGDRDSLQLVGPNVSVRIAATKMGRPEVTLYDEEKIMETYGVTPKQLIDIKAIQGDSSDNIPGVAGIGQKGASDLIQRFGNIDYIYENIDTIDVKDGIRKKLVAGKESAYMSRMLGTIVKDAPIDTTLEDYIPSKCDTESAIRLMTKLEFFSLIEKMGLKNQSEDNQKESESIALLTEECANLSSLKERLRASKKAVFIADYDNKRIERIVFNTGDKIYSVKEQDGFIEFLKDIFEDESIPKQTHNIKPVYEALEKMGINAEGVDFDTLLAAYLLNPSSSNYDIERLAQEYGITGVLANKTESEAYLLPKLIEALGEKIKENSQDKLLQEIELPLAKVLAEMENVGFEVDADGIKSYGEDLTEKISKLTSEIYESVGYEFNINSPKQLGVALFEKLGLPTGKKTKSGYSTSAEVLENLKYVHPCVDMILEYRAYSKLKSTYCDGMLKVISEDGRIHSNFNQTETRTGRISSTEPNLQNIPVRTEMGRELRKFFCAKDGCVLVDSDYSQIELRVLAHVANDKNMIRAFEEGDDIHAITASEVFNVPMIMVTPLIRSRAKAVNFGIVYGISAFSLAKDINVTRKEADTYIKEYLKHYSGIDEYMQRISKEAKEKGYVETMFGRRRYLPELSSSNFALRSFGERVARNMPIQGAAADIIKIAMIKVSNRLKAEKLKSRLILQVHDELIVEAPEEEATKVAKILRQEMENAVKLNVPLLAESVIGKTWYDAKG